MWQLAALELETLRRVGDARTHIEFRRHLREHAAERMARHDDEHIDCALQRGREVVFDREGLGKRSARQIPGVRAITRQGAELLDASPP